MSGFPALFGLFVLLDNHQSHIIHKQVSVKEAKETVDRWYSDRKEVLSWQEQRKSEAHQFGCVYTLLGRARWFPSLKKASSFLKGHIERAAINTPVQVFPFHPVYLCFLFPTQVGFILACLRSILCTYFLGPEKSYACMCLGKVVLVPVK